MEADDAALARALMMEEMAAADAAGIDYSPTFRKRRRDSTSDDDFDPTRRKASKATKPQAPKPEPPPKPKPAPKPRAPRVVSKPKEVKASFVARGVTLAHLIDARLIAPGRGAVSTTYNDVVHHADVLPDGYVAWDGREFASVSAFSLAVKRKTNPGRKADDGWKCVSYMGTPLDRLKRRYEEESKAGSSRGDGQILSANETMGPAVAAAAAREIAAKTAAAKLREESRPKPHPRVPKPKVVKPKVVKPKPPKPAKPPRAAKPAKEAKPASTPTRVQPRRERRGVNRALTMTGALPGADGVNGDLQMVECEVYDDDDDRAQPWRLSCTPEASFLMDFHSHLCRHEIIGFLGGTWDPHTRSLNVKRALPARRLVLGAPGENASVEVELDPESVPDIVEALDRDGLRVVGWYHSHPVFSTHPSLRDVENQANYQRLFRDDEGGGGGGGGGAPFVGAIVGPYATRNPDLSSDVRWFHVAPRGEASRVDASEPGANDGGPFELRCDRDESASMDAAGLLREARGLADVFGDPKGQDLLKGEDAKGEDAEGGEKEPGAVTERATHDGDAAGDAGKRGHLPGEGISNESADRVDMRGHWRDGTTRMEKLARSLKSRLPSAWQDALRDGYVGGVLKYLRAAWNIETDAEVRLAT